MTAHKGKMQKRGIRRESQRVVLHWYSPGQRSLVAKVSFQPQPPPPGTLRTTQPAPSRAPWWGRRGGIQLKPLHRQRLSPLCKPPAPSSPLSLWESRGGKGCRGMNLWILLFSFSPGDLPFLPLQLLLPKPSCMLIHKSHAWHPTPSFLPPWNLYLSSVQLFPQSLFLNSSNPYHPIIPCPSKIW